LEPPPRPKGRIIEGEPKEAAKELVKLLHEEAKVL
ncbi:MAG: electron transfer flavoprotein beta subunit/FixA family protein, partial [Thermoanaerobaculaceae bacterium]|nr:electron transfer flavoprotein beta subunit/FixA family protein [Thermoanaerobaculaceae bacterium]